MSGIHLGNGNKPFAAIGTGNVQFDSVVCLHGDGTGTADGTALTAGVTTFSGSPLPTTVGDFAKQETPAISGRRLALSLGTLCAAALRSGGIPRWLAVLGLVSAVLLVGLLLPVFGSPKLVPVVAAVSLLSGWMLAARVGAAPQLTMPHGAASDALPGPEVLLWPSDHLR